MPVHGAVQIAAQRLIDVGHVIGCEHPVVHGKGLDRHDVTVGGRPDISRSTGEFDFHPRSLHGPPAGDAFGELVSVDLPLTGRPVQVICGIW
ncbi:MAG: hypothetical protein ABI083_20375 [Lapillicoccus sp.]